MQFFGFLMMLESIIIGLGLAEILTGREILVGKMDYLGGVSHAVLPRHQKRRASVHILLAPRIFDRWFEQDPIQ